MEKENMLVSACLLGVSCRYDGRSGESGKILELMKNYNLIPVCPEQLGGMKTPRKPAECRKYQDLAGKERTKVVNQDGEDMTEFFMRGASEVLKLCRLYGCKKAVLKERSPSCGFGIIYDGTFTGKRIPGNGVTAELLGESGITVLGESGIDSLLQAWNK